VRFQPELGLKELEYAINTLERQIRDAVPQMKKIFVEPDSDYDAAGSGSRQQLEQPRFFAGDREEIGSFCGVETRDLQDACRVRSKSGG